MMPVIMRNNMMDAEHEQKRKHRICIDINALLW